MAKRGHTAIGLRQGEGHIHSVLNLVGKVY